MSYYIVNAIITMCSLNLRPGVQPPVKCINYMSECMQHDMAFDGEAPIYIRCQSQYMTLYNSYASFKCPETEGVK